MAKHKYTTEFEIKASKKMLYQYLDTPGGLSQWFADDVTINEDKVYNFIWDGESHKARMISHRTNHVVRFEFLPEKPQDELDPSYLELKLDMNELTEAVFMRITDYSEETDEEELHHLWSNLISNLKEIVGG